MEYQARSFQEWDGVCEVLPYKSIQGLLLHGKALAVQLMNVLLYGRKPKYSENIF